LCFAANVVLAGSLFHYTVGLLVVLRVQYQTTWAPCIVRFAKKTRKMCTLQTSLNLFMATACSLGFAKKCIFFLSTWSALPSQVWAIPQIMACPSWINSFNRELSTQECPNARKYAFMELAGLIKPKYSQMNYAKYLSTSQ